MRQVAVLVPTYRRPERLAETLQSLARQRLPPDVSLRVVVVDNDAAQSARKVVNERGTGLQECTYVCEPVANVSLARNRALREAHSTFAAFIDDDEIADADWLCTLLQTQKQFGVAAVLGPVIPQLPGDTARWIREGRFFERPRLKTGAVPSSGATGNVLLNLQAVRAAGIEFDPAYGNSGGEDADFFHRLQQAGLHTVWCDEALVYEHVSVDRTRARWLLHRAFVGGRNYARIFQRRISLLRSAGSLLLRSAAFVVCGLLVPLAALGGVANAVRVGRRSAGHLGRVVGLYQARWK